MNQLISSAVGEKLAALKTEAFLGRAKRGSKAYELPAFELVDRVRVRAR